MRLRDNWWERDLLCSPSTTQHNFCFFTIRIFEHCMFKQILKLTNMYLFWKGCVWEIIDEEDIYCARLAQFSTAFIFSKKQNGGACKKMIFFQNYGPNFHFLKNRLRHKPSTTQHNFCFFNKTKFVCSTIQHKPSTIQHNFCFFWKNKMAVLTSWTLMFAFSKLFIFIVTEKLQKTDPMPN